MRFIWKWNRYQVCIRHTCAFALTWNGCIQTKSYKTVSYSKWKETLHHRRNGTTWMTIVYRAYSLPVFVYTMNAQLQNIYWELIYVLGNLHVGKNLQVKFSCARGCFYGSSWTVYASTVRLGWVNLVSISKAVRKMQHKTILRTRAFYNTHQFGRFCCRFYCKILSLCIR